MIAGQILRATGAGIAHRIRPSYSSCFMRTLSYTPRCSTGTDNKDIDAFTTAFQQTTIFKKVADRPEAVEALTDFAKALQNSGVDMSSGKPPSAFKMLKLFANSEFKASAKRLADEMNKAGIDFSSKEVLEEVMSLRKIIDPQK